MSAIVIIIISIAVAVVFGVLAFLTLARRSDVRGAGALSAETVRRDSAAREAATVEVGATTGAQVEAEAADARRSVGTEIVPASDDTALAPFVSDDAEVRRTALRESDCAPLVRAHEQDRPLLGAWLEAWRERWPPVGRDHARGLEAFAALLAAHARIVAGASEVDEAAGHRDWLEGRLVVGFRRHTHQPAAVYFHLALVAMDVARLRGELVRHRLFSVPAGLVA